MHKCKQSDRGVTNQKWVFVVKLLDTEMQEDMVGANPGDQQVVPEGFSG